MAGYRRTFRLLGIGVLAGFALAVASRTPAADEPTCGRGTISGTLEVGDGSTPPCDFLDLWAVPETGTWSPLGQYKWGTATIQLPAGTWRLAAHACDAYYPFRPSQPVICRSGENGCVSCDGPFKLSMFGLFGGFTGQVRLLPSGLPAGLGVPVGAAPGVSCNADKFAYTDANGIFTVAPTIEPHRGNHWGLAVDGDGSGPGSRSYLLTADSCDNGVTATTFSSVNVTVDLYRAAPYMAQNDPSARPLPFPPLLPVLPPGEVGRGISPTTGNVFLDQTDLQAWGASSSLTFVRSYNSRAAAAKIEDVLGPGWSHSYDAQLTWPEAHVAMVRDDDGSVVYFEDTKGDGIYRASVPMMDRSRLVKTAAGFERRFSEGRRDIFSPTGRLVERIDAAGRVIKLVRDAAGRLLSAVDPDGRKLTPTYGADGRLVKLSMGTEALVAYGYDAASRLQRVTYGDGSGFTFAYDDAGQLLQLADLAGRTLRTYAYENTRARRYEITDGQERVSIDYSPLKTTVTDALGRVTNYEWTTVRGVHLVTAVVGLCTACADAPRDPFDPRPAPPAAPMPNRAADSSGADLIAPPWPLEKWPADTAVRLPRAGPPVSDRHRWTYDFAGRLLSYSDAAGRAFSVAYDDRGDPNAISDGQGGGIRMARDAAGRVTAARAASAVDPQQERATFFGYDEKGRLASRTESGLTPDGRSLKLTTRLAYDEAGRLVRAEGPRSAADALTFAYDAAGNLILISDGVGVVRRFAGHTALGYPTSVVEGGHPVTYAYGPGGQVLSRNESGDVSLFAYSATGRLRQVQRPRGNRVEYVYDAYDRLAEERIAEHRILHKYDRAGQHWRDEIVAEGGGAERERNMDYDALGRLVRLVAPPGHRYEVSYNNLGRPEVRRGPGAETTTLQFDENGRVAGVKKAGPTTLAYRYDPAGRLVSATDGEGAPYRYAWDDLGRLRAVSTPAGAGVSFDYNGAGEVTSRTDGRGVITGFDYDPRGRPLRVRFPHDRAIEYFYDTCPDGRGRLCAVNDGTGRTTFAYDNHGRLTQEIRETTGGKTYQTGYSYDANGNLAAVRYPSGRLVSYAWDESDQVRSVSSAGSQGPASILANLTHNAGGLVTGVAFANGITVKWTRDAAGRVRSIRGGPIDETHAYDAQGNLSGLSIANAYQTFEYDGARRLTAASGPWGPLSWSYDGSGNRLSDSATSGSTSYTYQPHTHRLLSVDGERATAFAYDGAGQTILLGHNRVGYDEAGRLSWFGQETRLAEYTYDYKGRRVSKKTPDSTVLYHYDSADRLIAESSPDGVMRIEYVYAGELPVALFQPSLSFIHTDAAGVPTLLTSPEGQLLWERSPRPFGDDVPAAHVMTPLNLRAPGQYYDHETGFFHNGRRTYVPKLGRYLEPNPCAGPDEFASNVYGYAAANPLTFIARRGLSPTGPEEPWTRDLWPALLRLPTVTSPDCPADETSGR
jgi:RHS repeat-associated protein